MKNYINIVKILLNKYDESNKKEAFVNSLNNYDKSILKIGIYYRNEFPNYWEQKILENTK